MGHLQVVTGISVQLYGNAWGVLSEFWGMGACRDLIITVGALWGVLGEFWGRGRVEISL